MKRAIAIAAVGITAVAIAGCSRQQQANNAEQNAQNTIQSTLDRNQPIPLPQWSDKRQVLIDVQNAQIKGITTTSFFFNQGVKDPIFSCASIGFPLPSTAQLTNPKQVIYTDHPRGGNDANVVDQMDPDGVYSGDSTGTYVECIDPKGIKYIKYWEGYVDTLGAPAHWEPGVGEVLDGEPTVVSTPKK
jgi:hypothetical protein